MSKALLTPCQQELFDAILNNSTDGVCLGLFHIAVNVLGQGYSEAHKNCRILEAKGFLTVNRLQNIRGRPLQLIIKNGDGDPLPERESRPLLIVEDNPPTLGWTPEATLTPIEGKFLELVRRECSANGLAVGVFNIGVVMGGMTYDVALKAFRSLRQKRLIRARKLREELGQPWAIEIETSS